MILFGILDNCKLDVSIDVRYFNSNFVKNNKNMIVNILMHEIGHVMILGYTSKENNSMNSTEFDELIMIQEDISL